MDWGFRPSSDKWWSTNW